MIQYMAGEEIGPLLQKQMIHFIPDAAQLQGMLDMIFRQLKNIPVE